MCLKCGMTFSADRKSYGSVRCRKCKSGKYVVSTAHPLANVGGK